MAPGLDQETTVVPVPDIVGGGVAAWTDELCGVIGVNGFCRGTKDFEVLDSVERELVNVEDGVDEIDVLVVSTSPRSDEDDGDEFVELLRSGISHQQHAKCCVSDPLCALTVPMACVTKCSEGQPCQP